MVDLLIKNAKIYDGTGAPAFHGCVAVKDGRIVYVGEAFDEPAARVEDAQGLALAPGFIDVHSHADCALLEDPNRLHVLRMGVTTEISGQCGSTLCPVPENTPQTVRDTMQPRLFGSVADQRRVMEALPIGPNQRFFTGHGVLRAVSVGLQDKKPTNAQMDRMRALLFQEMEAGSMGLSTGLSYAPGIYSDTAELTELARAAGEKGGMYTTHSRSESAGLFDSVAECIHIAREGRVPVNISHFKVVGARFWDRCPQALGMIDEALAEGLDITLDCYPYTAVCTTPLSTVPPQFLTEGGPGLARKLEDPETVRGIYHHIFEVDDPSWDNSMYHVGLENFLIVRANATPWAVGKTYVQVGEELGLAPFDAWVYLMRQNHCEMNECRFAMKEENVEMIFRHPACMVGSDGTYIAGDISAHPRGFGTFPRYLGHYIRERQILSREEGIRRITGMPALRYGLAGKGFIKEGYDGDLVLFDYDTIRDRADYMDPFQKNEGIRCLWMKGEEILRDNEPTGIFNGTYLA